MSHHRHKSNDVSNKELLCPHCYAKNVVTAYCCLNCFKVMHPNIRIPLWKRTVQSNRTIILFCVFLCLSSIILMKRWLNRVETHLTTIQSETARYHEAVEFAMKNQIPQE